MRAAKRHAVSSRSLIMVAGVLSLSACSLNTDVSQPSAVQIVQGNLQSAAPNTKLPTNLSVIVVTQFGMGVSGVGVEWTVLSGGGTVDPVLTQTDDNGIAATSYTTGAATGTATVQAKATGLPPITFTVNITSS